MQGSNGNSSGSGSSWSSRSSSSILQQQQQQSPKMLEIQWPAGQIFANIIKSSNGIVETVLIRIAIFTHYHRLVDE